MTLFFSGEIMTEKTDKQIDQNKPQPLKGSLPDLFESFRRADISLPQAIIIAAILIAIGLLFS